MNTSTRNALTALALASILGVTACSAGSTPTVENPTQGTSASATPSVDPNKAKGFSTSFEINGNSGEGVPADWKGGEGQKVNSPYVVGKYVGYLALPESGDSAQTASPSAAPATQQPQLLVIDEKGTIVYKSKNPTIDYSELTNTSLGRVSSNGKNYLVYVQGIKLKQDPSSTRTAKVATSVTIVDEQGKEVSSQVINESSAQVMKNAITIFASDSNVPSKLIDPVTGKVTELSAPEGHEWYGNYDGVNIFGLVEANGFSSEGSLTDGTWTAKVHADIDETSVPTNFGTLMMVKRFAGFGQGALAYDLMDPHTGKVVLGADLKDGIPFSSLTSFNDQDILASPNNKFVITNDKKGNGNGVFSIVENKHYPIAKELNFEATSVTDEGYVYGQSTTGRAGFNIVKESEPKVLAGVYSTPKEVSASGIAVFGNSPSEGYVVLKPQS